MYHTGLLLLTGAFKYNIELINHYLNISSKYVKTLLYVKLETEFNAPLINKNDNRNLSLMSQMIPKFYQSASKNCANLDVRILVSLNMQKSYICNNFDVILTNSVDNLSDVIHYVTKYLRNNCSNIIKLKKHEIDSKEVDSNSFFETYGTICLGGTFDRLHNGHKVLLSEALMRATKKVIIGVTDGHMLKKKLLWELIEPVKERIEVIENFVKEIDSSLEYEILPIIEPYGPTIIEPDIDCIIVSQETQTGGKNVNVERAKRNFKPLAIHVVNLVENTIEPEEFKEIKLSSTSKRIHQLGKLLHYPEKSPKNDEPYLIFLNGCPMSGKSCIAEIVNNLGLAIISCENLLSTLIKNDANFEKKILHEFGPAVISSSDLSNYHNIILLCIKNKEIRTWLSFYLSEPLKLMIEEKIRIFFQKGIKIMLIQDSNTINIDFKLKVHQVWTTILPISKIIEKLILYYNLTEHEAKEFINTFPAIEKYVQEANIIFSNQWSLDNLHKQVENALSHLKELQ